MNTTIEVTTVQGIPTLTLTPVGAAGCPVVFFVPGYGGTKEAGLDIGYPLARQGFCFVSFDPMYHGERYDPRLDNAADPALGGVYPAETGLDTGVAFFRVIGRCLQDVQTLMAHLSADSRFDLERCGATGSSMGGCASFLLFAELTAIRTAVPMIGIPSFARRWHDLLDECALSNPGWAEALRQVSDRTREHTRFIEALDPGPRLATVAPKPLFVMNCDFDTDQPKLYAIRAVRDLLPYYRSAPGDLRLRIFAAGHRVTSDMRLQAVDWFCWHLKRREERGPASG